MNSEQDQRDAQNAINQAAQAYRRGDRTQARRWASLAARLDPTSEKPWLILAGLASPHASIAYLKKALELNPNSQSAHQGMEWAVRRLREHEAGTATKPASRSASEQPASERPASEPPASERPASQRPAPEKLASTPAATSVPTRPAPSATQPVHARRGRVAPPVWAVAIFLLVFGGLCVASLSGAWMMIASAGSADWAISMLFSPSPSPSATVTPLPTHTHTAQPTATLPPPTVTPEPPTATAEPPTATLEPTATLIHEEPEASLTPVPVYTLTEVPPTETPWPTDTPLPEPDLPSSIGSGEHWIDVDLSDQMVYAYEGDVLVNSFLVSTGTWRTPTVIGEFKVYVKYRYADMSGPGYYLADVPYVMYFYKGYGLHGTYWHNNFGTPMSHGCVNLRTDEAGWLFDWSSVGTVVNVHD